MMAGNELRIKSEASWPIAIVDQYHTKMFDAVKVNYERLKWDKRSHTAEKADDQRKEKIIIDWIVRQRVGSPVWQYDEKVEKRPRMAVSWRGLMERYEANIKEVDTSTKKLVWHQEWPTGKICTPNWERELMVQVQMGTPVCFNRRRFFKNGNWTVQSC